VFTVPPELKVMSLRLLHKSCHVVIDGEGRLQRKAEQTPASKRASNALWRTHRAARPLAPYRNQPTVAGPGWRAYLIAIGIDESAGRLRRVFRLSYRW
jgi:hypothetical protein